MYFLVPLTILSMFIYMYFYFKSTGKMIFILKTTTSMLFLITGLVAYLNNENPGLIGVFLLLGLFFGMLGDIGLGYRYLRPRRKYQAIVIGLGMFFVGHTFYSSALLSLYDQKLLWLFLLTIFIAGLFIYITKITNISFGRIQYIVYLYMLISSFVLSIALLNFINNQSFLFSIMFFGSLLFVLSDLILCYIYFKKISHKTMRVIKIINILVYYIGQIFFALSLYFL